VTAIESNFVFTGGRKEERRQNANVSWNPATGANFPFATVATRPFPQWGTIAAEIMDGRSNYRGWENSFTKRFSNRWQAQATYSLSWYYEDGGIGAPPGEGPYNTVLNAGADIPTQLVPLGFEVARDLRGDYGLGADDQRHRATINGIWEMGMGFQLSGLYFFGSGQRFGTNFGGDQRGLNFGSTGRLASAAYTGPCPGNTVDAATGRCIWPKADIVGDPIHRVDIRLTKRQRIAGTATIDGIVEVFNLFNHENFGSYTTAGSNPNYGRPSFNGNVAYQPRIVQLGFRFAF
jgi:hypothetical protein